MEKNITRPQFLSAGTLKGDAVVNTDGESIGHIEEIMLDMTTGYVAYAVLSFGGFLGLGDKLFAIPWRSLTLDPNSHSFILDVDKEMLQNAAGFDKDNWPEVNMDWLMDVYSYYDVKPYWS